jgi:hypothetical protein
VNEHQITLKTIKELTRQIAGQANTIVVPRILVSLTGDHVSAILLSQIIYWSERTKDPERWFYKTTSEWFDEIGLSYSQLATAIEKLRHFGLETAVKKVYAQNASGGTPKAHYRLNEEVFYGSLLQLLNEAPESIRTSENPKVRKSESEKIRSSDNLNPTFRKSQSDFQKSRKSYKEAEPTTEPTTKHTQSAPDGAVCEVLVCGTCGADRVKPLPGRTDIGTCEHCSKKGRMVSLVIGTPKSRSSGAKRKPPPMTEDARAVIDEYKAQYFGIHRTKPQIVENDRKAVESLISEHGRDAVIAVLSPFLRSTDKYILDAGHHLYTLPYRWNQLSRQGAIQVTQIDESKASSSVLDKFFGREVIV